MNTSGKNVIDDFFWGTMKFYGSGLFVLFFLHGLFAKVPAVDAWIIGFMIFFGIGFVSIFGMVIFLLTDGEKS